MPHYIIVILQSEDKNLLKEIGKNGEGRPEEVQQLVDEVNYWNTRVCFVYCISRCPTVYNILYNNNYINDDNFYSAITQNNLYKGFIWSLQTNVS